MASIRKRGRWQVRWRTLSGEETSRSCPNKRSAEALKRDVEEMMALGHDWCLEGLAVPTVEDVVNAYLGVSSVRLKPRTFRRYRENLNLFGRFVETQSGAKPMTADRISKGLLEDFHVWLLQPVNGLHGRRRSGDTARKIVEVVQLCWEWAEDSDRWDGHIPRPRRLKMIRKRHDYAKAPTWEEMDACVMALGGWQHKVALVLRYSGLRVSEAMTLTWTDLDLQTRTLHIRSSNAKEGQGRVIPMSPHLVREIAGWGTRLGYLIPSGRCSGVRHRQVRARDFQRAWQRAGVRREVWEGQPTHAFRKGFKSNLLMAGAHADAVDFLQGHTFGGGSRGRYIDPYRLPLEETALQIPEVGSSVISMPKRKTR